MKLTIIPSDGLVSIDGFAYTGLQQIGSPSNVHALQWQENKGWIEFSNGIPNQDIEELPTWVEVALSKWEEAKLTIDTVIAGNTQVQSIEQAYPIADVASVNRILSNEYVGLSIGHRIRSIDNAVIGVEVKGVAGVDISSGGSAMLAIRRLTEDCVNSGVPVITIANFPTLSNTQFGEYYKALGGTDYIDLGDSVLVYTPWTLAMAKERKKAVINTERVRTIAAGITYAGNVWDADPDSIAAITARNSINQTSDVVWRTKDNSMVQMTASGFSAFAVAIVDSVHTIYEASWARKTAVDSATTEDEVNAI